MRLSLHLFKPRVTRNGVTTITKNWNVAWRDPHTGERRTVTTGTANKQAAELFKGKLEDRLYREAIGAYDPAEEHLNLLYKDAKEEFLKAKSVRLRPDSVDAYRYSLSVFERLIDPKELRKIDVRAIHRFVSKRTGEVKPPTVNKDLRQLRAFLNWCRQQGYLVKAPSFHGQFVNVDKADPKWVSEEDVKAVVAALCDEKLVLKRRSREWWLVFLRVALYTGMRRSELLGLCWSEVDLEANTVRVIRYTSKGRKDRLYEDAAQLTSLLKVWHGAQEQPPTQSAAVLPYDKTPRGLYHDWEAILEHAKIPAERQFTPHDCRSTCVSELLAAGYALTTVRDWVGHSTVLVTERHYAATRSDRQRVAKERKVV